MPPRCAQAVSGLRAWQAGAAGSESWRRALAGAGCGKSGVVSSHAQWIPGRLLRRQCQRPPQPMPPACWGGAAPLLRDGARPATPDRGLLQRRRSAVCRHRLPAAASARRCGRRARSHRHESCARASGWGRADAPHRRHPAPVQGQPVPRRRPSSLRGCWEKTLQRRPGRNGGQRAQHSHAPASAAARGWPRLRAQGAG
ncbi:hypothetical protein D3C73_1057060 [compost metagenome]